MKNLLIISSVLLISGCATKNANNQYQSTYSYHSYLDNYTNNTISNYNLEENNPREYQLNNTHVSNLTHKIEQTAKSHLGKPYVWGANGPYSFDCSGFTKAVYSQFGMEIPRVSKEQAKYGQIVPWQQLQKGDLIFFDSKKSSKVSHVGIYLGEGSFIHASSSKHRVVISNLTSSYYSKHFKWGRRLTQENVYASR